jgi:hypothetical protein
MVMWTTRGQEWNGAYAEMQGDEWLYSAYIQALIDGRPRRNDPYTGRDDLPNNPQPESLFSIQFVPAYLIATPSRLLGLSSSTAFIILGVIASVWAYLSVFWLLLNLLEDRRMAALGSLVVLCFGGLVARQGLVHIFSSDIQYAYVPFSRRYEPAAVFWLFFVFCTAVWKALYDEARAIIWAIAAGIVLVLLIFSYFYLWTAATAWLFCLGIVWLANHRDSFWKHGRLFLTIFLIGLTGLVPYFILLSRRSGLMEAGQKLTVSHAPDLLRGPELLSIALIGVIVWLNYRKRIDWREKRTSFALSFIFVPFVVFNQQVLTGRSLQPFHYEMFIANYLVLIGAVLTVCLCSGHGTGRAIGSNKIAIYVALIAVWWGALEVILPTRVIKRNDEFADQSAPVGKRLREWATQERNFVPISSLVFVTDNKLSIILPTFAPQPVLWAPQFDFLHLQPGEARERFYKNLYYSGIRGPELGEELSQRMNPFAAAAFGHERVIPDLAVNAKPITRDEISSEVAVYENFCKSFTRDQAASHVLSYAVVTPDVDLTNLDRWYERDQGEQIGPYMLYRVRLRP